MCLCRMVIFVHIHSIFHCMRSFVLNPAQAAAWCLAAGGHLVVVRDHFNLHQLLKAVVWLLHTYSCLSPGRLGRLHCPERNRDLQGDNTTQVRGDLQPGRITTLVKITENTLSCLTLSCMSLSMASSPAIWLVMSGLCTSSKVSHGAWTEATRAATPTIPSMHPERHRQV